MLYSTRVKGSVKVNKDRLLELVQQRKEELEKEIADYEAKVKEYDDEYVEARKKWFKDVLPKLVAGGHVKTFAFWGGK